MFFRHAVEELKRQGHEVMCTSRKYREAVELAKLKKLDLKIVGRHGGADRYSKLRMSASRIFELSKVADKFKPDVVVSFSSPEAARVAYGLGTPQFAFNDSPHSEAVARLTLPLVSRLYCPWVIPASAWARYAVARKSIVKYRALDPAAWLKHEVASDEPETSGRIVIRLEESQASYMADRGLGASDFIDYFVNEMHAANEITLLCRYQDQIDQAEARYGTKVEVLRDVVDGTALLRSARLFIGAGGTMTAEAALLGTPTISITPLGYYVERYLIRSGLVKKATDPRALVRIATRMLSDNKHILMQKRRADKILRGMEDPTSRVVAAVSSVRL